MKKDKEFKNFRKENTQQFEEVEAQVCKTNARLEEAEGGILDLAERVQTVTELLKLESKLESQITKQEGRSCRKNVRIYGVVENEEKSVSPMIDFVEIF